MKICKQLSLSKFSSKQGMGQDNTAFFVSLLSYTVNPLKLSQQLNKQLDLKTRLTKYSYGPTIGFQVKITNWPIVIYFAMVLQCICMLVCRFSILGMQLVFFWMSKRSERYPFRAYLGITNDVRLCVCVSDQN